MTVGLGLPVTTHCRVTGLPLSVVTLLVEYLMLGLSAVDRERISE